MMVCQHRVANIVRYHVTADSDDAEIPMVMVQKFTWFTWLVVLVVSIAVEMEVKNDCVSMTKITTDTPMSLSNGCLFAKTTFVMIN